MHNAPVPPPSELPTTRQLIRSSGLAVGIATLLLVVFVLPAEYGVDPTGLGDALGLKRMGEIKVALAIEAEADAAADAALAAAEAEAAAAAAAAAASIPAEPDARTPDVGGGARSDSTDIFLQPGEGREIKLSMSEGAAVQFEWWTSGGVVNFDAHGDPASAAAGASVSYERGTGQPSDEGVITAAFDGLHGWFWRNRGEQAVTVTLRVRGAFEEMREIR